MLLNAAAVDLAFHSARVGLGGDGLMTNPALALNDRVQSSNEIIAAMRAAPKPLRITGETRDSVLRFVLSPIDRKSTRLNSSHQIISYAVFCLKKKKKHYTHHN